jgi:nucleotide-binding universal stress UspA family protein
MSDKALERAIEVAAATGARITLLYVVEEIPLPLAKYSLRLPANKTVRENFEKFYKVMEEDGLEMLQTKTQRCKSAGVPAKAIVTRGHPVKEILAAAEKEGAELVVMGSVSRSGLSKLKVIGGVARRVSESLGCPVMLVR